VEQSSGEGAIVADQENQREGPTDDETTLQESRDLLTGAFDIPGSEGKGRGEHSGSADTEGDGPNLALQERRQCHR